MGNYKYTVICPANVIATQVISKLLTKTFLTVNCYHWLLFATTKG